METLGEDLKLDRREIEENKKRQIERFSLYKSYGYDQIQSRKFIIQKARPIKERILEIGGGKGYLTVLLAKEVNEIVTVDIDPKEQKFAALNAASENVLHKIKFIVRDAAKLQFSDKSFDIVISANAFHHFEYPFAVLREMIRVCKSKLVIADFNDESLKIIGEIHKSEGRVHKEGPGDFKIVGTFLKESGFSDVKSYNDFGEIVYVALKKERR